MPRFGRLAVDVLEVIPPDDSAFRSSADLAALARSRILAVLDEPDGLETDDPVVRTGKRADNYC